MMEGSMEEQSLVRAFLRNANQQPLDAIELLDAWRMVRIALRCPGAGGLVQNPNAPAKIRGAWGRAMAAGASSEALAGGPCAWQAPCAYDLFFNVQGQLTSGLEIPKPYVVAIERDGSDLLVHLTLFGIAGEWAGEAADALVRGLRAGLDGPGARVPLGIAGRAIERADHLQPIDLVGGAILRFVSPMALRDGQTLHVQPASLLTSLANRVGGLALWQGRGLKLDAAQLKTEAERLGAGAEWHRATQSNWRRGSRIQGRQMEMAGVVGDLHLPPPSPTLAALLRLGMECHVGSRTALGMGRYQLLARRQQWPRALHGIPQAEALADHDGEWQPRG
jgi:hypothetical protein